MSDELQILKPQRRSCTACGQPKTQLHSGHISPPAVATRKEWDVLACPRCDVPGNQTIASLGGLTDSKAPHDPIRDNLPPRT